MASTEQYEKIKKNIEELINIGKNDIAEKLLLDVLKIQKEDPEIYSMLMIVENNKGDVNKAIDIGQKALEIISDNFDILYNLAYCYSINEDYENSFYFYNIALQHCYDEGLKKQIDNEVELLKRKGKISNSKIVFFYKKGMNSFIKDIIKFASHYYEIKAIEVTDYSQIDTWVKWADICWFEWCDELIVYGSNLNIAKEKVILCRMHRYEVFTVYPQRVNWNNVNKLIIVTDHLKELLRMQIKDIDEKVEILTINNGVDIDKYEFKERRKGFNLAYVGYIHSRKNPVLLLQIMKKLVSIDSRYKLYVAGMFQEPLIELYWNYQVKEMNLENNVIFQGWQSNIAQWLENKNYIVSSSIHESFGYGIAEAMCRGIKPVIHNFIYSKEIWDEKYIFNTVDEAVDMILADKYDSNEYRKFITEKYSLNKELALIHDLFIDMEKGYNIEENKIISSINQLNSLNYNDIVRNIYEFSPYTADDFNEYDFTTAEIYMGKVESINEYIYNIEFILNNGDNKKLIITGCKYSSKDNTVELMPQISQSKRVEDVIYFINKLLQDKNNYGNDKVRGYIYDKERIEDVKKNEKAYMWERGIPGTHYMPIMGYRNVLMRYFVAENYLNSKDKVLEAACGYGYGAAFFSKKNVEVYALDLAEDNILFATQCYNNKVKWIRGDVLKLPFENDYFDVYTSFETLEHLEVNSVNQYFQEAKRVLKNNGMMILSTPNKDNRQNINNPYHIKEYTSSELDKILKEHFTNIKYFSITTKGIIEEGIVRSSINIIAVCSEMKQCEGK